MMDLSLVLTLVMQEDHLTRSALAKKIGIATATLARLIHGGHLATSTQAKLDAFLQARQADHHWYLYLDETFGAFGRMDVSLVIAADPGFPVLRQMLYPYGWTGGDEVKGRGKSDSQSRKLLADMAQEASWCAVMTTTDMPPLIIAPGLGVLMPYAQLLVVALRAHPCAGQLHVTLDARSDFDATQFKRVAELVTQQVADAYAQTPMITITQADSKKHLGLQAADLIANATHRFSTTALAALQVTNFDYEPSVMKQLLSGLLAQTPPPTFAANGRLQQFWRLEAIVHAVLRFSPVPAPLSGRMKQDLNLLWQQLPKGLQGQVNVLPNKNFADIAQRLALILRTPEAIGPNEPMPQALIAMLSALETSLELLQLDD